MKQCTKCLESKPISSFYTRSKKYVRSGYQSICKACDSARGIKRQRDNKEAYRLYMQQWRLKNPEKSKLQYIANKDKIIEQVKKYRKENPEMRVAQDAKRRADKQFRTPAWLTPVDFERIRNVYKLADLQTKITGTPWEVDHIIPLRGKLVSGLHVPSNLEAVPMNYNRNKRNKFTII